MAKKQPIKPNKNEAPAPKKPQPEQTERRTVSIPPVLTVKEFADTLKTPVGQVIASLMKNGVIANLNENIDSETAMIIGDEFGFDVVEKEEEKKSAHHVEEVQEDDSKKIPRPPVVAIMGHVDHGKTTLIDYIRKSHIASSESGGITQHIGAYQAIVETESSQKRLITFLDTPGHEAFSAMRAHGASITDIVILVVAADDGVKPQTVEAINHARVANVPIIVAINKIDLPGANPDRVKQELAERDLVSEEWGGKTIMVPISAKKGENIQNLLEMVILTADLKDYKTNVNKPATGIVIESHMQVGVGPLATILVNDGTLKQGDIVAVGDTYGKIRFMEDYKGKRIKTATASTPTRIAGLNTVPNFGELVITAESEKTARQLTSVKSVVRQPINKIEMEDKTKEKDLNIILKTDVQGSLEALKSSIEHLGNAEVKVKIISEGVGDITDSDVNLAETASAVIVGFRVSVKPQVKQLAERKKVQISIYEIIYQILDDLHASLSGMLEPEDIQIEMGKAQILKIFLTQKEEQIVGAKVTDGKLSVGNLLRIIRNDEQIADAKITTLRRNQNQVEQILSGTECGIGVKINIPLAEGDKLEAYQIEQKIRSL